MHHDGVNAPKKSNPNMALESRLLNKHQEQWFGRLYVIGFPFLSLIVLPFWSLAVTFFFFEVIAFGSGIAEGNNGSAKSFWILSNFVYVLLNSS